MLWTRLVDRDGENRSWMIKCAIGHSILVLLDTFPRLKLRSESLLPVFFSDEIYVYLYTSNRTIKSREKRDNRQEKLYIYV